ncbi:ABC transporter permease [Roseibium limicola]|uniref:ABC transporter permease n=1 Tax=Roseibium limicola TaxID=2816037 RepID=A0A939EKR1_9HYPH|nr:ABC transporter permease [Roseibium limicola]MBO0343592.1 ABC transporter permease [Roseibium limicola]
MAFKENSTAPTLEMSAEGDVPCLRLAGDWVINRLTDCEAVLADAKVPGEGRVRLDLSGLSGLDTSGAWVLHRFRGAQEFNGRRVQFDGLDDKRAILFEELEKHHPAVLKSEKHSYSLADMMEAWGRNAIEAMRDGLAMLHILGSLGAVLAAILVQPKRLRSVSAAVQFERTCIGAVPIVMLMSFLIGVIISQQGGFYLRQFGADLYVVDLAGVLVLREIGVILTAIMVAGRSGSAITAEIGAMRMREEVDALHVIGMQVTEVLILPRVLALMLAVPVLTFLSDIASLFGAGLVAWAYLDINPQPFMTRLQETVTVQTFVVGLIKAPFMALIVGLIASVEGLKVGGSAESLGKRTTMAVVKAIFLVIVVDGIFAVFFAAIGV